MGAFIIGSGTHLPERVVSNEEIAASLGLDPAYIFKSSGIRRRRWAASGTTTSSLATGALKQALNNAQLTTSEIDYLILGTMTPDRFIPGSAPSVQVSLGLREIPCLDIRATCCNALYGLQIAKALVTGGAARCVAIGLADIQSAWLELSPKAGSLSMLFGDGASALIVSNEPAPNSLEILEVQLATDGSYVDKLGIRCPGTEFGATDAHDNPADYVPRMNGQIVILQAVRKIVAACQSMLKSKGLTPADVRWVVPHQANGNLLAKVVRDLQIPAQEGRLVTVLEDTGNTASASMGIALDKLRRSAAIRANDYVLLPAFGAGFTWGTALCRAL